MDGPTKLEDVLANTLHIIIHCKFTACMPTRLIRVLLWLHNVIPILGNFFEIRTMHWLDTIAVVWLCMHAVVWRTCLALLKDCEFKGTYGARIENRMRLLKNLEFAPLACFQLLLNRFLLYIVRQVEGDAVNTLEMVEAVNIDEELNINQEFAYWQADFSVSTSWSCVSHF